MSNMFREHIGLEMIVNKLDNYEEAELEEVLKFYPFQNILNISILDFDMIQLCVCFMRKLSQMDMFYNYIEVIRHCWEFTLINLSSAENLPDGDLLLSLLELLKCFVFKLKNLNTHFSPNFWKDRERVFDILTFVARQRIFTKPHASVCTVIFVELMKEPLPKNISKNLADVAEVYKRLEAVHDLAVFCELCFTELTLSKELLPICTSWLMLKGPALLLENIEEETLLTLVKVISECHLRNVKCIEFTVALNKVSHRLILFSINPTLRDNSLKLFSILLCEHFKEVGFDVVYTDVSSKLSKFPTDISDWPGVNNFIFFYVCHYLLLYSSLPWNSSDIIESLHSLIYSYERFAMNWFHMKHLCYVYSMIMSDVPTKKALLLGDELLIILSQFTASFPKIITYHVAQLAWMLNRGCPFVKRQVLIEWLKRGEDLNVLGKAIIQFKVGNILLDILIDWKYDKMAYMVSEMCHRIQSKELSENIASLIPTALHNKRMLGKLILSNPGIPDCLEAALKISEFMSAVLCLIDDARVLRAACVYSKYLVTKLKHNDNVVTLFCSDIQTIRFLFVKIQYTDEETAVEILRLLKVLILVQKRNRIVLHNQVDADFSQILAGSEVKTEKCLDLLQLLITSNNVFIKLANSDIFKISTQLFIAVQNSKLAVRSFVCLTGILKANEWLARIPSTNVFVEIQCSLSAKEEFSAEFIKFLTVWLKILKKCPVEDRLYLPDRRIIANYIKRSGIISQSRANYMLHLLSSIKIFPEKLIIY